MFTIKLEWKVDSDESLYNIVTLDVATIYNCNQNLTHLCTKSYHLHRKCSNNWI